MSPKSIKLSITQKGNLQLGSLYSQFLNVCGGMSVIPFKGNSVLTKRRGAAHRGWIPLAHGVQNVAGNHIFDCYNDY